MNVWPILIVGVLFGISAFRRERLRKVLSGPDEKLLATSNKELLPHSLKALIDFLSKNGESKWSEILNGIRLEVQHQSTEAEGLSRLRNCFGGMGSLNDLNLKDPHTGLLLDAVFRDMKLFYGGPEDRIQWSKLEELYKGDLPPRIKNAFGP